MKLCGCMVFVEVTEVITYELAHFQGLTQGCRVYTYSSNLGDQVTTKYILFLPLLLI